MDVREKLVELLVTADDYENSVCRGYPCKVCPYKGTDCTYKAKADHLIANGVTVQEWIPVTERLPDVERLIAHWQSKADELKKSVEDTCGEASTVSTYKWMHSLWRTVCEFVADLDDLATHCEINNYVENCEECGFCKKGE